MYCIVLKIGDFYCEPYLDKIIINMKEKYIKTTNLPNIEFEI